MRCPWCGGTVVQRTGENEYWCTSQILADVVPPGVVPGLPYGRPVYRNCNRPFTTRDVERADRVQAEAARAEAVQGAHWARIEAERREEMKRKQAVNSAHKERAKQIVGRLVAAGSPGLQARTGGRYEGRWSWRRLETRRTLVQYSLSSAWPVGEFRVRPQNAEPRVLYQVQPVGMLADGRLVHWHAWENTYETGAARPGDQVVQLDPVDGDAARLVDVLLHIAQEHGVAV